ncbi:MAG: XdhC family protein [Candidatus Thorarchaeota archaeon]
MKNNLIRKKNFFNCIINLAIMISEFVQSLTDGLKKYFSIWIVTIIHTEGSSPRKIGAKMIVAPSGELLWGSIGGGNIERIAIQVCTTLHEPKLMSYNVGDEDEVYEANVSTGMICGGNMTLFYEPIGKIRSPTVWIFGAGHCGKAVYDILSTQDWNIIMLDNRKEILTGEKFPNAERRLGDYSKLISEINFTNKDYILIMTQGHKNDEELLRNSLKKPWKYLGMMGSKKKVNEKFEIMLKEGTDQKLLQKVNAPIGLSLGGQTPEEIAVDIVAKLIQVRYSKNK